MAADGREGVSGYRTQSPDTSREVEELLVDRWRAMTPTEKLWLLDDLQQTASLAARAGIRTRNPRADEDEIQLRLAALRYDREFMIEVFGWDPRLHGY